MFLSLFVAMHSALTGAVSTGRLHRSARGITFIEYALLGAIAVVLGFLFRTQLTTAFNGLLADIREALSTD